MSSTYSTDFYSHIRGGSSASATIVAERVVDIFTPRSLVDVGCGTGEWLRAVADLGVDDYLGVDGAYVSPEQLSVARERFVARDLGRPPYGLARTFDLALSLEVAEHLPAAVADAFVGELVALAPVVVFSAAIPGQAGPGHVNEQWPGYWAERFARAGYAAYDCLREPLWNDARIAWWYRQNLLVFVRSDHAGRFPKLNASARRAPGELAALVHPEHYLEKISFAGAVRAGLRGVLPSPFLEVARRLRRAQVDYLRRRAT